LSDVSEVLIASIIGAIPLMMEAVRTSTRGPNRQVFCPLPPFYLMTKAESSFRNFVILLFYNLDDVALGGVVVSVLATVPKVRGFKPGLVRWILRVIKSVARLPSEGK
jgi:hypothetical protein